MDSNDENSTLRGGVPGAEKSAQRTQFTSPVRYGLAILSVGIALGAALLLEHFHFRVPAAALLLFAVAISSWFGGRGPAVLAVVLSTASFYWYFVEPVRTIYIYTSEIPYFLIFAAFASLISWFANIRHRIEAGLQKQAALLNLTHDTIFVMDMDGVIASWNRGAEERYGWSAEQAVGQVVHDMLKTVFPSPLEEIKAELTRTGRWEGELVHTKKDGTQLVVASRWSLQRDGRGAPVGILETNNDITERKRAEEALGRLNRELRAISNCNQFLLRATDERSLIQEICRIVCEEAGYPMAWVAYAEHDEAKSVRPVAWGGTEEEYLATAGITWADTERGRGPTGTAIRSGKTCCIQDSATDPRLVPREESFLPHGCRSGIALPLKDGPSAFGSLTIYSLQPNAFTSEEIRLLEELAADLAFGIVTLRSRAARKQAEESLRESERKYHELVEHANSIILHWQRDGRIVHLNEFGQRLFGYTEPEIRGRHVIGTIVPETESSGRDLQTLIDGICVDPSAFEQNVNENMRRDGERVWIAWTNKVSPNSMGEVTDILSIGVDITARKRAEEQIQQQQMELRQVLDFAPQLVAVFGPDRERLYANRPALDYFGVTLEEWQSIPDRFWFFHPDDREHVAKDVYTGPAGGIAHEFEARMRKRDGVYRWFLFRGNPLRDERGHVMRWYLTATDIEDRKRAEEERQAQVWFLESMDRINRVMQGANDLEQVMSNVLDAVLSIFDCDRACFVYPLDPEAPSWRSIMERTRPEFPGAFTSGASLPINHEVAQLIAATLASSGPLLFGPAYELKVPAQVVERFGVRSQMAIAVYPKVDGPYFFALHQCRSARVWTAQEQRLFQEVARRLADSFTSLLMFRSLHESEEALRASEAYLAEAQRLSHTGSWAWDMAGDKYVYVSEEDYRIWGFDPREGSPTGEAILQRIHPEDRNGWKARFEKALREKADSSDEYRIVLPDGTMKHVYTIRHPVLDDLGDVVKLVGTSADITERKGAEEALRESETRFRTFVDHAGDAFFVYDLEHGSVVDVNRQACEGLGYTRQELIGQLPLAWHQDSYQAEMESLVQRAVAGETVFDTHWHRRKDGTVFPVEVHSSLVSYGGRRFLLKVARDISDRLRAEEQRERLRQLEADLAHINRVSMMGELVASIAHEVSQPLSGVVSNASACLRWLAADAPNLEEVREAVGDIVRDGKRAGEVITRIRALTRRAATPREKLDLNETIREVLVLVGDQAKRNSVTIRTRFAVDIFPVLGDRVQLQQVALNLIKNGIEAMSGVEERARELVITTRTLDPEQMQVTVEDSGTGLDPKTIQKIFDPFYTTKPGGMGMGLAICRSILQAHGGRLWAEDNDGGGTMFHFTLPKCHEEAANA
jgi:PAS domain S-box-containing protein